MNHDATDYQEHMQQAALEFARRHQAEYLRDERRLFERTGAYLVNALDVPLFMAERLAYLAMTQLDEERPLIGIDRGQGDDTTRICLVHQRTGERAFIPLRLLPHRLQPAQASH